jgi:ferredoxin
MRLRITIDHTRCLASGACARLAPEVFAQGGAGLALVRSPSGAQGASGVLGDLSQGEADRAREAAMFCPPEAITVCDDETGEQLFP